MSAPTDFYKFTRDKQPAASAWPVDLPVYLYSDDTHPAKFQVSNGVAWSDWVPDSSDVAVRMSYSSMMAMDAYVWPTAIPIYAIDQNDTAYHSDGISGFNPRYSLISNKKSLVIIGDSLSYAAQPMESPTLFDGRTFWSTNTPTLTNLGAGQWIVYVQVDSRCPSGASGTLETDGNGNLRWTAASDTAGAYVDVSSGGWYLLESGTVNKGILVAIRGTEAPTIAGTGSVTTSGIAVTQSYQLTGYATWVAGILGETFANYHVYGITGAKTGDIKLFAPQAFPSKVEACLLLMGVNNLPATAAAAATAISDIIETIDICRANANKVYVLDIFPNPSGGITVEKFLSLTSRKVKNYCDSLKSNVRFISSYQRMCDASDSMAVNVVGRTGIYHTDNLHLMPYGAYQASKDVVAAVSQDYSVIPARKSIKDVWDTTLLTGALNANPALRGIGGTVTAAKGITGTVPDNYTMTRTGAAQLCTTSFVADTVNLGLDWFCFDISNGTNGDYHELNQDVTIPSGVNVGDFIRLVCEFKIFDCTGEGLNTFQVQANANSSLQSLYLLLSSRNITTFSGGDNPELLLASKPQYLLSGVTTFTMRIRVGGRVGATGKVGFRLLRLEKVDSYAPFEPAP